MSTSTVNQPKPTNQPGQDEWQEVKAVELYQWKTQGQLLEGIFVSIEPETFADQRTGEPKTKEHYYFDLPSGARCKIRETADLKTKMQPKHLGHKMRIRYESDKKLEKQQEDHNDMKIFKVQVGPIATGYEHLQAA